MADIVFTKPKKCEHCCYTIEGILKNDKAVFCPGCGRKLPGRNYYYDIFGEHRYLLPDNFTETADGIRIGDREYARLNVVRALSRKINRLLVPICMNAIAVILLALWVILH